MFVTLFWGNTYFIVINKNESTSGDKQNIRTSGVKALSYPLKSFSCRS